MSIDEQGLVATNVIRVTPSSTKQNSFNVAFVYRLGLQVFILARGVRFPYAMPYSRQALYNWAREIKALLNSILVQNIGTEYENSYALQTPSLWNILL